MYKWIYNINSINRMLKAPEGIGELTLFDNDVSVQVWNCVTGGWGNGPCPEGIYLIDRPIILADIPENNAFKLSTYAPWLAHIWPQFQTTRTGLCIHPDGGYEGTLGCIGVKSKTDELRQAIEMTVKAQNQVKLEVKYLVQFQDNQSKLA